MSTHALLSPSSSHRWISCPPSARLSEQFPEESGPYAQEGTAAHALCAYLVEKALGRDARDPSEDLDYLDDGMRSCAEGYASFVLEEYAKAREICDDPQILIEQEVDFSRWVPEGTGTADCLIVADDLLEVIDFKYGLGVPVSAGTNASGGNTQLMCYALGTLRMFDSIYDIKRVKLVIYQPRRENVCEYLMEKEALLAWANTVLTPAAKLAFHGEGDFHAGEHCRFCKARSVCKARAEANMALAAYDFKDPALLTDEEIDSILLIADRLTEWASDVREYALSEALKGKAYEHFKVVEGRSSRKYVSEALAAEAVLEAGFDPYEKKVLGITAMTALLGKQRFEEILGSLTVKPEGKPTLALRTDKRPERRQDAKTDFETKER